jgi:hypothetical protein
MNPKDPRNFWNNVPNEKKAKTVRDESIAAIPREHDGIEDDEQVKMAEKF